MRDFFSRLVVFSSSRETFQPGEITRPSLDRFCGWHPSLLPRMSEAGMLALGLGGCTYHSRLVSPSHLFPSSHPTFHIPYFSIVPHLPAGTSPKQIPTPEASTPPAFSLLSLSLPSKGSSRAPLPWRTAPSPSLLAPLRAPMPLFRLAALISFPSITELLHSLPHISSRAAEGGAGLTAPPALPGLVLTKTQVANAVTNPILRTRTRRLGKSHSFVDKDFFGFPLSADSGSGRGGTKVNKTETPPPGAHALE